MTYPVHATCQCGSISYTLTEPPIKVLACHCKECQTFSSAPFSVTSIVKSSAIEFKGEMKEWSRPAESGNTSVAKFCPNCGTRIYHMNPDDPDTIKLKLKPKDSANRSILEPLVHIWVSEKQDWYDLPAEVERVDKQA